jgi:hypothetical protein
VDGVRKWQFLMIYSTVNHQWVGGPQKVKNMMTDVMRVVTIDATTASNLYHHDAIYKCGR